MEQKTSYNVISPSLYQNSCKLNRTLLVSSLLLIAIGFFQGEVGHFWHVVSPTILYSTVGLGCVLWVSILVLNEMIYHTSKRLKEASLLRLTPYLHMLLYAFTAFFMLTVLTTKLICIPFFIVILAIQAQYFKRPFLAAQLYIAAFIATFLIVSVTPFFLAEALLSICTAWVSGHYLSRILQNQSYQVEILQSMATTDALTRLVNRRQFNTRLNSEVSRARRHHSALSLALFDIDNFKHLNDHYGHPVGDRILQELGQLISKNVRESDVAARYGGEEFALILPETREKEASDLLERLRQLVSETVFCLPDNPITLTVSIGVSELNSRHNNVFELVERADQALYQAKGQGKNRVYIASQGVYPLPLLG